jgi:hypothetical protein
MLYILCLAHLSLAFGQLQEFLFQLLPVETGSMFLGAINAVNNL